MGVGSLGGAVFFQVELCIPLQTMGRLDQKVPKLCFGMGLVKEITLKMIKRN